MRIEIPYHPMPHQLPFIQSRKKVKQALLNWHRQSGKDLSFLCGWLIPEALETIGNYWYCFPGQKEIRRDFWDKKDNKGRSTIGYYIPEALIYRKHAVNRTITLQNLYNWGTPGSMIECVAVDTIDPESLRGATLKGAGYSEFAHYKSDVAYSNLQASIRSKENNGWQVIVSTPKGHNHHWRLFNEATDNPYDWFTNTATIDDTGLFDWAFIEAELRRGKSRDWLMQEFYCSFNAYSQGVVFAESFEFLQGQGRITHVPWNPNKLVHTAWDLGHDGTVVWCFQSYGEGWAFIECISDTQMNFEYYVEELRRRPYVYGTFLGPWDLKQRQYFQPGSEKRLDSAFSLGIDFDVQDKLSLDDQESAARSLMMQSWFDARLCEKGLEALREYHYPFDEELGVLNKKPRHDWTSHFASAFQTAAIGIEDVRDGFAAWQPSNPRGIPKDLACDYNFPLFGGSYANF